MGCYISKCEKCGKEVNADDQFLLNLKQYEHIEEKHPEIFKKNKKAREIYSKKSKEINDELIYSEEILFKGNKWEGEAMSDEKAKEGGYL